jgi:protein gp37
MAARFSDEGMWGHGFAKRTPAGGRWTGNVAVQWDRLTLPLTWRKPARIFASSTSDWFHERLPMDEIATMTAVAVAAVHLRGHKIQILTKRSDRMCEVMNLSAFWDQVNAEAGTLVIENTDPLARRSDDARATLEEYGPENPPPGIWLGVSVEDQQRADERIPHLLSTPARVRFLSCEPLLGPLHIRPHLMSGSDPGLCTNCGKGHGFTRCPNYGRVASVRSANGCTRFKRVNFAIHWVICGGESGPNARPMHPDWARSLCDQCQAAGVPFFFKQWGEWAPSEDHYLAKESLPWASASLQGMCRVGKKASGAALDGREWREFPHA